MHILLLIGNNFSTPIISLMYRGFFVIKVLKIMAKLMYILGAEFYLGIFKSIGSKVLVCYA